MSKSQAEKDTVYVDAKIKEITLKVDKIKLSLEAKERKKKELEKQLDSCSTELMTVVDDAQKLLRETLRKHTELTVPKKKIHEKPVPKKFYTKKELQKMEATSKP